MEPQGRTPVERDTGQHETSSAGTAALKSEFTTTLSATLRHCPIKLDDRCRSP
jgi:hypothetical protein